MKKKFILCGVLVSFICSAVPVKIILDTDMVGDYDDAGALAMLHAMADAGEAEILGVVACTPGSVSVSVIEIINRFFPFLIGKSGKKKSPSHQEKASQK